METRAGTELKRRRVDHLDRDRDGRCVRRGIDAERSVAGNRLLHIVHEHNFAVKRDFASDALLVVGAEYRLVADGERFSVVAARGDRKVGIPRAKGRNRSRMVVAQSHSASRRRRRPLETAGSDIECRVAGRVLASKHEPVNGRSGIDLLDFKDGRLASRSLVESVLVASAGVRHARCRHVFAKNRATQPLSAGGNMRHFRRKRTALAHVKVSGSIGSLYRERRIMVDCRAVIPLGVAGVAPSRHVRRRVRTHVMSGVDIVRPSPADGADSVETAHFVTCHPARKDNQACFLHERSIGVVVLRVAETSGVEDFNDFAVGVEDGRGERDIRRRRKVRYGVETRERLARNRNIGNLAPECDGDGGETCDVIRYRAGRSREKELDCHAGRRSSADGPVRAVREFHAVARASPGEGVAGGGDCCAEKERLQVRGKRHGKFRAKRRGVGKARNVKRYRRKLRSTLHKRPFRNGKDWSILYERRLASQFHRDRVVKRRGADRQFRNERGIRHDRKDRVARENEIAGGGGIVHYFESSARTQIDRARNGRAVFKPHRSAVFGDNGRSHGSAAECERSLCGDIAAFVCQGLYECERAASSLRQRARAGAARHNIGDVVALRIDRAAVLADGSIQRTTSIHIQEHARCFRPQRTAVEVDISLALD